MTAWGRSSTFQRFSYGIAGLATIAVFAEAVGAIQPRPGNAPSDIPASIALVTISGTGAGTSTSTTITGTIGNNAVLDYTIDARPYDALERTVSRQYYEARPAPQRGGQLVTAFFATTRNRPPEY